MVYLILKMADPGKTKIFHNNYTKLNQIQPIKTKSTGETRSIFNDFYSEMEFL